MAPRLNTLVEVQALSLTTQVKFDGANLQGALETLRGLRITNPEGIRDIFKTIGTATNVRINEQWGTQPIYAIGGPTRPVMVPGNYQLSLSIEKLQLDRKNNFSFLTTPDYWYSTTVQREVQLDDYLLYTYLVVRDKERPGLNNAEVYAVMPSSATQAYTTGDATIVHNVDCVGFKLTYVDLLGILTDNNILAFNRTTRIDNANPANDVLGTVINNPNTDR